MPFASSFHSRCTASQTISSAPEPVTVDALEAEVLRAFFERCGKRDLLLDRALGIDLDEEVLRRPFSRIALRGEPEAAVACERDAFEIELLGGCAVAGHERFRR